jgi:hypothetical protein
MSESFEFGSCWTHSAGDNRAAILLLDTEVKGKRQSPFRPSRQHARSLLRSQVRPVRPRYHQCLVVIHPRHSTPARRARLRCGEITAYGKSWARGLDAWPHWRTSFRPICRQRQGQGRCAETAKNRRDRSPSLRSARSPLRAVRHI